METRSIIVIFLLLGLFALLGAWHLRENKQVIGALRKRADDETAEWLARFIMQRTYQLLGIAALAIILIIGLDHENSSSQAMLAELTQAVERRQALEQQKTEQARQAAEQKTATATASVNTPAPTTLELLASAPPAPPMPENLNNAAAHRPPPAPMPAAPVLLSTDTATPLSQALATLPEEMATDAQTLQLTETIPPSEGSAQAETAPAPEQSMIERVYNPERTEALTSEQSVMDDIKKRYEDILVLYLFMTKCGRAQPTDYNVITSALAQEMASVNAPSRLHNDIVESARGSYQEIYSESSCQGEGIDSLQTQYSNYVSTLQSNFSLQ